MICFTMGDILLEEPNPYLSYEAEGLVQSSFERLSKFLEDEVLCDVEIQVGKKSIKCHRVVLACCSSYFRAMFTSSLAESKQKVVTISDIDENAMELLIKFAYTAKILLTVENVQSLLHAASVLQMDLLAQACCEFMRTHLHPTNCLGIRQFAERHGYSRLVQDADAYACTHFQVVSQTEDFMNISASHLLALISSSDLCVENETQVFETVLKWVKHDECKRKDLLPGLLARVRLPFLPTQYIKTYVEPEELIRRSFECRDLLDEARDYQLWQASLVPGSHLIASERVRPRKCYAGVLFCVGGRGSSSDPFSSVECYSWLRNKWFHIESMSTKRRHVGCTSYNGKVYAVGGCDEKQHLGTAEIYDPIMNCWSSLSSMAIPRRGLGLGCLGGAMYAVGGLDDTLSFSAVERYDLALDLWSMVASMNVPRGGLAVAVLKGFLYAIGGSNGPTSLNSCERYDPHLNKWTFITPMNQSRAGCGCTVIDGLLYVAGGFENNHPLKSAECYNPDTNTWSILADMSEARGGVGVAQLGNRMYAVGGHNGSEYLKTVEVYDPLIDRWELAADISICRAGAGVAWCPILCSHMYSIKKYQAEDKSKKQENQDLILLK